MSCASGALPRMKLDMLGISMYIRRVSKECQFDGEPDCGIHYRRSERYVTIGKYVHVTQDRTRIEEGIKYTKKFTESLIHKQQ